MQVSFNGSFYRKSFRKVFSIEFCPRRINGLKLISKNMIVAAIEAKGFQPLKVTLKRLGGWPVVRGRSWKENNFDWISSIRKFRNVGYNFDSLIAIRIKLDPNNRRRRVIEVRKSFPPKKVSCMKMKGN